MRTLFLVGGITLIVVSGISILVSRKTSQPVNISQNNIPVATPTQNLPEPIDSRAGFAIFTHGTFRIFTAPMYHNLSQDVYIQADNPNLVHVKKQGITWQQFFDTLPFKLTNDCLVTGTKQTFCTNKQYALRFYLNGKNDASALEREIRHGDQLLVSYGRESEDQIQAQLQRIPIVE